MPLERKPCFLKSLRPINEKFRMAVSAYCGLMQTLCLLRGRNDGGSELTHWEATVQAYNLLVHMPERTGNEPFAATYCMFEGQVRLR